MKNQRTVNIEYLTDAAAEVMEHAADHCDPTTLDGLQQRADCLKSANLLMANAQVQATLAVAEQIAELVGLLRFRAEQA